MVTGDPSSDRTRTSAQRKITSDLGDLLHSSARGWESYLWSDANSPERNRYVALCRPQDFDFILKEGDCLTVRPKERTVYCAGIDRDGVVTLVTTVQNQQESAEVFMGPDLSSLRRCMAHQIQSAGSRIEARVGDSTLTCSRDAMLWSAHMDATRLRMLPAGSLTLSLDHQEGTARLAA